MGRISRTVALRAMETAFDQGVTHFDVARSYGYGDAEAVLGKFAAGKRDRITIATKFGIRASTTARALRWIKPAVRRVARHFPYARSAIRAASGQTLVPGRYGLADARGSFEESLRQLKTDYADILFIHDCSPADELSDELLAYLQNLVHVGRVRAWGIATRRDWISLLCAKLPFKPMIVQYGQDILSSNRIPPCADDQHQTIFHSPFGASSFATRLNELLIRTANPQVVRELGADIAKGTKAYSRLLLEGAFYLARGNPVLCSMFDPAHIWENVAVLENPRYTPEQLAALVNFVDTHWRFCPIH